MRELLSTKAEPDEIERRSGAENHSPEKKVVMGMQPMVKGKANPTPNEEARYQVANNRPESALFVI